MYNIKNDNIMIIWPLLKLYIPKIFSLYIWAIESKIPHS